MDKLDIFDSSILGTFKAEKLWRDYLEYFVYYELVVHLNNSDAFGYELTDPKEFTDTMWMNTTMVPFSKLIEKAISWAKYIKQDPWQCL
jgi:hypothetical protein